ncbi:HAMP domain-containing protein [Paenibacillus mesophilus]|uniref:sensor histidine kinase n=1 Tax=Paenibacillus mesophilus TaxID=2582849 RepID=UPI00110F55F3|nr:ATP-binding protein [Paenibacillus mesophilus]TMV51433.1 HAMP domain-containing protein [Paenibacillus mesophilus]
MSVRRKLFAAMASIIVAMSVLFVLVTLFVVRATLEHVQIIDRSEETREWSELFAGYYEQNGGSWNGVRNSVTINEMAQRNPIVSLLLLSPDRKTLFEAGNAHAEAVYRLGIQADVHAGGETVGKLYYYDPEAASVSIMRIGISSSVTFLLLAGAIVFAGVSLLVAFLLSKRLTAPLRQLIPVLDRLGKGELGVQAPVTTKDEFGRIAESFNAMSGQLQRAEQARRNLVADVAHELRTPLTIIRGKLDLVQQRGEPVEPESLLPLQDDLIRLTRMVDELHQLSLAEARKLPLERKPTNMRELLERIAERITPDAEAKRIEVTIDSSGDKPTADADPNRMTQVFLNLLVNAVRYTPEDGKVAIVIEEQPGRNGEGGQMKIAIADSGIGIESKHLPFLFDRFYRTEEARTRHGGGMGLGLAIAKEFVTAHGGSIEAASAPGRGTTFTVTLPRA